MLPEIAAVIAPLFLCAGIGYFWARFDKPFDPEMITGLALTLGLPALVFSTLTRLDIAPGVVLEMGGAYAVGLIVQVIIHVWLLRAAGLDRRTYLAPIVFGNSGNMGLPVCLFAFGEPGLGLAIGIFIVSSIAGLTASPAMFSGDVRLGILFKQPLLYVIGAALIFMTADIAPPRWVANTVQIIGGMAIPLMIISLGVAMARLRVNRLGRSLALSCVRIGGGLCVGIVLAWIFGFEGMARGVLLLQCAMPVAVHNYLFAQRYDRDPPEVAGMVVISTALSYATLPLLLWYVL